MPGAAYFFTEYVQAYNVEGNPITIILSYDLMSSLSIGSKLQDLNFNHQKMKTASLPIKTLYNVTEKSYDIYHLKFIHDIKNQPRNQQFLGYISTIPIACILH